MRCTKASDSSAGPGSVWLNRRSRENEPVRTRFGRSSTGCGTRSIAITIVAPSDLPRPAPSRLQPVPRFHGVPINLLRVRLGPFVVYRKVLRGARHAAHVQAREAAPVRLLPNHRPVAGAHQLRL